MNQQDEQLSSLLKRCEFIRYERDEDSLSFLIVDDSSCDDKDEDHCHINGDLLKLVFKNVSSLTIEGEEADSYIYEEVSCLDSHLHIKMKGRNYLSTDTTLIIDFAFETYENIFLEHIKEAEV